MVSRRQLPTSRALVLDLELACWKGEPPVVDGKPLVDEVVEIGLVELDMDGLVEARVASYLVRPIQGMDAISDFFVELTGIQRSDIEKRGHPLPDLLRTIAKEFGPVNKSVITWGNDCAALMRGARLWGIPDAEIPFRAENFINIGQMVSLMAGAGRRIGLVETMEAFGVDASGLRQHSAVNDARATGRMFMSMAADHREALAISHGHGL